MIKNSLFMKSSKVFKKRIPFLGIIKIIILILASVYLIGCRDGYLLKTIRNYNQSCKCYGIEKKNSKWSINPYY